MAQCFASLKVGVYWTGSTNLLTSLDEIMVPRSGTCSHLDPHKLTISTRFDPGRKVIGGD